MNRNGYRDEKSCCYFHPKQVVVGVCPLCLNERLILLAAKQGRRRRHQNHPSSASKASSSSHNKLQSSIHRKPSTSSIHKIFAFASLFNRPESRLWKSNNFEYDVSPSPEDSFISIKFEENGVASWEKSTTVSNKVSLENRNNNNNTKSVIEHGKSRDMLRWRKRIGHVFQLIRWRKSTGGVCHVGSKVERGGVKAVRKKGNWMRTLTKRRKTTTTVE